MELTINLKRIFKRGLSQLVNFTCLLFYKPLYTVFKRYFSAVRIMIRQSVWKVRLNALGENTNIYLHVVIHNPENVKIGNNVFIAEFVHIWGGGGIEIGDYTIIAAHSTITSLTHDTNAFAYEKTLIKNRLGLLNVFGLVQALSFYLELQSVKGLLSVREPL